ncbi:MAG: PorP/SprF family type IX secretion system membrane protein [Bacteroidota bacterium]
MRKSILLCSLFIAINGFAQDVHFTQTTQTPLLINPAACGVLDGWERIIINHRNQWLGAGTQFMTTNISAEANIGKSRMNDKAHLGLGILFYNDIGGDSRFGMQRGAVNLSGILPMGNGHSLSAGLQGAFVNRSYDLSRVTFNSQWDGENFDPTLLSGEGNSKNNFMYFEAAGGLFYSYDAGKNSFQRNNDFKFQLGISGYNLNRPELRYAAGEGDRLYRKWVAHTSVVTDLGDSRMALDASFAQFIQGPHLESLFGMMLRYRFEDGTKITGNFQDAYFGAGLYYRLKDAISPAIMVDWKGFRFGVSYDITVSALRKAYRGGSLEFNFSYTNLSHALFKSRR